MFLALGAGDRHLNSLFDAGGLGRRNSREPIVFRLLAGLAPFWLVLQTLVVKENLLADSPREIAAAINTSNGPVLIFGRLLGAVHCDAML